MSRRKSEVGCACNDANASWQQLICMQPGEQETWCIPSAACLLYGLGCQEANFFVLGLKKQDPVQVLSFNPFAYSKLLKHANPNLMMYILHQLVI